MFAIVIYNKESGELKCWRDRFGIKPLYYHWDGKNFAFASELKALLTLPLQKEINSEAIHDYFFLEYIPQPKTPFKFFFKLGNGQRLCFDGETLKIQNFYSIEDHINPSSSIDEARALQTFSELFSSSVEYRTISDVPIGAFLSGGSDSSAVCAAFSEAQPNLKTFNIGFENAQYNESHYAKSVAASFKTDHYSVNLTYQDLLNDFDKIVSIYDEPFSASSVFPTFKVSEISKSNITVAMSGDGGDELFMGYGHYTWLQRLKNLDGTGGQALRMALSRVMKAMPSRYARISKLLEYGTLKKDWPHIWSQEQYMFSENEITGLTGVQYLNQPLRNSWQKIVERSTNDQLALSLFDLKHYLADDLLYKVDMASMANSLEVRLPFLDHRLVEFVMSLPSNLKIKDGEQKYLLKKYLATKLPKDLVYRQKWGFGAPVDQWLKKELKGITKERLEKLTEFDQGYIQSILKDFYSGKSYLNKRIWALVMYSFWKEKYT